MENLFDALCSALAEQEAKKAFDEAEGVQLMVLIMKANQTASTRAIKVLDYACQTDSDEGKRSCETFVDVAGLKPLFAVLMGKVRHLPSFTIYIVPTLTPWFASGPQEIQKGTNGHSFSARR